MEETVAKRRETLIHHFGFREQNADTWVTAKDSLERFQLVAAPIIVLVAQSDHVGTTSADRQLEIPDKAEVLRVSHNLEGKWRLRRVCVENREGAVARAVVLHQQFIRQALLGKDAVQLLGEIPLAVVSAEDDADSHGARFIVALASFVATASSTTA